jgi:hypothetical protein
VCRLEPTGNTRGTRASEKNRKGRKGRKGEQDGGRVVLIDVRKAARLGRARLA